MRLEESCVNKYHAVAWIDTHFLACRLSVVDIASGWWRSGAGHGCQLSRLWVLSPSLASPALLMKLLSLNRYTGFTLNGSTFSIRRSRVALQQVIISFAKSNCSSWTMIAVASYLMKSASRYIQWRRIIHLVWIEILLKCLYLCWSTAGQYIILV